MFKKIAKYSIVIIFLLILDFILKKIYINNSIYTIEIIHYIFNINDFVRIFIFLGILIYFGAFHNNSINTTASKIVFCILISASLIYIIDRIIFRKIYYYSISILRLRMTFAAFLFAIGWIAEIVLLFIHLGKMNKNIKKIQEEKIDNLK